MKCLYYWVLDFESCLWNGGYGYNGVEMCRFMDCHTVFGWNRYWRLDVDKTMPRLYIYCVEYCEPISRLILAEIEALYFDGPHV